MAAKQIAFGIDARDQVLNGVVLLSKAVKATLGPILNVELDQASPFFNFS